MKEFEGIKLQAVTPIAKFGLIFWIGDELSQDLLFQNEDECDNILADITEGRGIDVEYDFHKEKVKIFPHSVLKVKFEREFNLCFDKHRDKLPVGVCLTTEIKFPKHIGKNEYQPKLSDEAEALNIMRHLDNTNKEQ